MRQYKIRKYKTIQHKTRHPAYLLSEFLHPLGVGERGNPPSEPLPLVQGRLPADDLHVLPYILDVDLQCLDVLPQCILGVDLGREESDAAGEGDDVRLETGEPLVDLSVEWKCRRACVKDGENNSDDTHIF